MFLVPIAEIIGGFTQLHQVVAPPPMAALHFVGSRVPKTMGDLRAHAIKPPAPDGTVTKQDAKGGNPRFTANRIILTPDEKHVSVQFYRYRVTRALPVYGVQQYISDFRETRNSIILTCMPAKLKAEIVTAAIAGFEEQKKRLNAQIAELRQMLNPSATAGSVPTPMRRRMSAAARARIAAAQRKRWAAARKQAGAA